MAKINTVLLTYEAKRSFTPAENILAYLAAIEANFNLIWSFESMLCNKVTLA